MVSEDCNTVMSDNVTIHDTELEEVTDSHNGKPLAMLTTFVQLQNYSKFLILI